MTMSITIMLLISLFGIMSPVRASDDEPETSIDQGDGQVYYPKPGHSYNPDIEEFGAASGKVEDTAFKDTHPNDAYVENDLSLTAHPRYVDSEDDGTTYIYIDITGTGYGETAFYYDSGSKISYDTDPYQLELTIGHKQENIENAHLDIQTSQNVGINTCGDEAEGNDYAPTQGDLALEAASFIPYVGDFIGMASFAQTTYQVIDNDGEGRNNQVVDAPSGDSGSDAEVGQEWNIDKNHEDFYDDDGIAFTFGTEVKWQIGEDEDAYEELEIEATIKNRQVMNPSSGPPDESFEDGAEASVEIPIKNGEIQSVLNYPDSTYYTSYKNYQSVQTDIGAVLPKYKNDRPDIKKFYVDWGDGSDWGDPVDIPSDYEPYSRVKNPDGSGYRYVNNTFPVTHQYTGLDEGENDFTIKVKAVCHDKYGGWSYSGGVKEITIDYIDDGGGGGGGCPYISPWNGTKYKRENNLMVQSEFQSGEVTDYYKLDTNLQQKNGQYSMKIEEFEDSEDFIDQMKLYTIDHKEGYKVGVTPEGEYITYKNSDAPLEAYNSTGDDVLNMVKEKNDEKRLEMDEGSEIILDYGDRSLSRWQFNKLILRSSGFSSHTEGSQIGILADKTSLYVSIKADSSDWKDVTVTHPRNNPHDYVIPLEDQITELLSKGHDLDDFKVKIRSTEDHHIDYVGLDNSAPTPVHVQEADLMETIKTDSDGNKKYLNRSLTEDDNAVMHLTPGESCTVNFDVPYQIPGFEERDFIVMTKGFYTRYE